MEVDGAGVAAAILPDFVGEAALSLWGRGIAPLNGALLKAQLVAAGFGLDDAIALGFVERLYGSKKFHEVILLCRDGPSLAVSRLRGVKDGGRCGLAPKTVDCD